MPAIIVKPFPLLVGLVVLFLFARPTLAFGAGNIASISKVEGQNWRHGDIEDALLQISMAHAIHGKKFDKMMVSRVYFGNWLRDYSQAIDVGTVKNVSAEAIRLLLCILGFLTFGYGSGEFEVTADRLGCYRPEDHIDNPKNYADNVDARHYDHRLRGPVDEEVELAIDPETGMKNYIANDSVGIMTSSRHVTKLFTRCVDLGRRYARSKRKADLYEALRLMGTGLHCLEDFLAHSNYLELALIEMGERHVFPHVGRDAKIYLEGASHRVYPCVTGTFGGVDFLHSVTGELSDKMTQNEIQELEGTLKECQSKDTSALQELLDKIPSGLLSGDKKGKMDQIQNDAHAAQMNQATISPREPEEYTRHVQEIFRQIMPAITFHDEVMQSIQEAIEKIPILPKILEQFEEQLSVFVFSVIAPFVVPVIHQIRNELGTGSNEIIESSKREQHIVFEDDRCTDPTHSMLSKDHFSNILNEPAGRTATRVVKWVVPQLMEAWDDDSVNVGHLCHRITTGVLHHPAQRELGSREARKGREIMFRAVEEWWNGMDEGQRDDYRERLTYGGVERGDNHKEGVHDSGHGCGGHLKMHKQFGAAPQTVEDKVAAAAASAIMAGATGAIGNIFNKSPTGDGSSSGGGGGLGGFMNSLLGEAAKGFKKPSSRHEDGDDSGSRRCEESYCQESYRQEEGLSYGSSRHDECESESRGEYGSSYSRRDEYESEPRREYSESYSSRRDDYESESRGYGGGGGGHRRRDEYESDSCGEYGGGGDYSRRECDEGSHESREYGGGHGGRRDDGYRRDDAGDYGRRDGVGSHGERGYGSGGYDDRRDDDDEYRHRGDGGYERDYDGSYGERGYDSNYAGYGAR